MRKDEPRDIVDDAVDAITLNQDVDWDRCARIATPAERRALEMLRPLARFFAGGEATTPHSTSSLRAAETAPVGGTSRRLVHALVAIAAIEVGAALVLLPWEWSDYRREYGDVAVYLTTWFLGHAASACLLLLAGRRDRRTWLLGVFFLFKATASPLHMLPAFWGYMPPPELMNEGGLFDMPAPVTAFLYLYVGPFLYAPACLWAFARECPRLRRRTRLDDLARRMVSVSVAIALALTLGAAVLYATRAVSDAAFSNFVDACFAVPNVLSLGAVAVIALRAHTAPPDEARRVALFAAGLALWMGFMTVIDVAEVFVPGQWLSNYRSTPFISLMHLGSFPGLALLWYSVLAARVPHPREVVRAGFRRLLVRPAPLGAAAAGAAVVLTGLLARNAERPLGAVTADPAVQGLAAATGLLLMLAVGRRHLLRRLDAWAYPETTDQRRVMAEATAALAKAERASAIRRTVTRTVKRAIGSPATLLALSDEESGTHDFRAADAAIAPLPRTSAIAHVLETAPGSLRVHPNDAKSAFELLPAGEAAWVVETAADVLVPVPGPGAEVVGILVVGRRFDDRIVSAGDLPFLEVLASAAGQALARLRLLDGPGDRVSEASAALECPACRCLTGADEPAGCACGAAYVEAEVPRVLAGRFRLTQRLGAGGMGSVYLAHDVPLRRDVAVKTLAAGMSVPRLLRLKPEAWAMATVPHPAVAHIYAVESWRGRPFLVVEFLPGGTLADRLRDGPLPVPRAVSIAAVLADALAALHGAGYLHRDIKPSNIGFAADASPKLLDFGLARRTQATTTAGGTLRYLSPEVLSGHPATEADDVWALCVVLYEMLSGEHPFPRRECRRGGGPHSAAADRSGQATGDELGAQCCRLDTDGPAVGAPANRPRVRRHHRLRPSHGSAASLARVRDTPGPPPGALTCVQPRATDSVVSGSRLPNVSTP